MQRDIILKIPMCDWNQIQDCDDSISNHKVMDMKDGGYEFKQIETEQGTRPQHMCEVAVPGACPRIQCFNEEKGKHQACRLLGMIQSQKNESGFWMKLPCSECTEKRNLHPVTEGFIYGEDQGSN